MSRRSEPCFSTRQISVPVSFLAIFCIGTTSHRYDSLCLCGFHIRRVRRRRHLVHQGRVLVFVAVLSISSVLLSVRVSDFVLFCSLGFLACGLVGLDLLHLAHIVGIVVLLLVLLVLLGTPPLQPSELRCVLRLLSVLQLPSLSRLRVDFVRVRLVLVPVLCCLLDLFCHSGLEKTSFPLVMSNPSWSCLMSCITSLCKPSYT